MAARSPPAESYLGLQIAGLLRGGQLGDGTGRQTQGPCAALWGGVCDCVLAVMLAGKLFPFARLRFILFRSIGHSAQARGRAAAVFLGESPVPPGNGTDTLGEAEKG